jgi:hypothetical protein
MDVGLELDVETPDQERPLVVGDLNAALEDGLEVIENRVEIDVDSARLAIDC